MGTLFGKRICMVCAENGAIPGGKVGGLGDVMRHIPEALISTRPIAEADIVMPGYGRFAELTGAEPQPPLRVRFRGEWHEIQVSRERGLVFVATRQGDFTADGWFFDHPLLSAAEPGLIYSDDPPGRPFASDASRFALFCAAVCQFLVEKEFGNRGLIHLHDWHAAMVAPLARHDPQYKALAQTPLVFSIHNLAMQGIRPFAGDESSLEAWFPGLDVPRKIIADPRYPDCFNPVRGAINLCDTLHTVSPSYAREICRPDNPETGFHGGEGLHADLERAQAAGRLHGILNGCDYPAERAARPSPEQFVAAAGREVLKWIAGGAQVDSSHYIARERLWLWREKPPKHWITSVTRLTPQKVALFQTRLASGESALENILADLPEDHAFVMLGSGDADIENFFTRHAARRENFLFLKGFSEPLANAIYALGELFLMPSSFEPCGISQMLAMAAGQPCLAHAVGGLRDTISNNVNGFKFEGNNPLDQATVFTRKTRRTIAMKNRDPERWASLCEAAAKRRFSWDDAAKRYKRKLYAG